MVRVMRVWSTNKRVRKRGLILLVAFFLVSMTVYVRGVRASTQTIIPAIADTYVDSANPDANYGSSLFLYTHNYSESVAQASAGSGTQNEVGPVVRTWLKFDLSQIPSQATIVSATLRMHTAMWGTRSINKVGVFVCGNNSWAESTISWSNAPSELGPSSLDTQNCANPDVDYNFAVSSAIGGKKSVSFVLETEELSKEPAVFNSKDLNPDTQPTLVVEYNMPADLGIIGALGLGIAVLVVVVAALIYRSRKGTREPS